MTFTPGDRVRTSPAGSIGIVQTVGVSSITLRDALDGRRCYAPAELILVPQCAHGHLRYTVGCVSCVLVHGRQA